MIKTINLIKTFGELKVLKGINMNVRKAEVVAIVGPSGAGKTTLLQIIGTLLNPTSGEYYFNDIKVSGLKDKQLARFRNKYLGFVFQFHHLLPEFTAKENVCIPAYIAKQPKKQTLKRAGELLDFLGLSERSNHKPAEMSGGEQQRVAVARALINSPQVVLADEPSGNLDSENKQELHKMFFTLRDEFKQTFIIVTHDESLATMADRKIMLKDGLISN